MAFTRDSFAPLWKYPGASKDLSARAAETLESIFIGRLVLTLPIYKNSSLVNNQIKKQTSSFF